MLRRTLLNNFLGGALMLVVGESLSQVASTLKPAKGNKPVSQPDHIKIHAQRFAYSPNHITIKQGDEVVLELTSSDFTHGFSIPDWNLRADIPPGKITLLTITPEQAGDFVFLCDNFCGEGHEHMQGKITVQKA